MAQYPPDVEFFLPGGELVRGRREVGELFAGLVHACRYCGLYDESIAAAAEAMHMFFAVRGKDDARTFFVSELCHPQNIEVVRTRAESLGIKLVVGNHETFDFHGGVFGALVQYPTSDGAALDYRGLCEKAHASGALVVVAAVRSVGTVLVIALVIVPAAFGRALSHRIPVIAGIGAVFGAVLLWIMDEAAPTGLPPAALFARGVNELLFPLGCACVLWATGTLARHA